MSQPQTTPLPYAHALSGDAHRQAWRTVARVVGAGCLGYGLLTCAGMMAIIIPQITMARSLSPMNEPIWQYILAGAYGIVGATLAFSGVGLILQMAAMRRLLVWSAGALILLSAALHSLAAVQIYSVFGGTDLQMIATILRIALFPIFHAAIICGMAIVVLTRPPLVDALKPA